VFDALGVPLEGGNIWRSLLEGVGSNSLAPLVLIDQGDRRLIKPFATFVTLFPLMEDFCLYGQSRRADGLGFKCARGRPPWGDL